MKFKLDYFMLSSVLLLIEIFIALYVKDRIIRPFVGDFLAVIFLYYSLASFLAISPLKMSFIVLSISYLIEWLQYIHFIELIGWEDRKLLKIILGSSFDWGDILAYTLGVLVVFYIQTKNDLKYEKLRS